MSNGIKIGGVDVSKALAEAKDEISDPENMRKYGEMAADTIRIRTRLGKGVAQSGDDVQDLKPLDPKYIRTRVELQQGADATVQTNRFNDARKAGTSLHKVKLGVSKAERFQAGGLNPLTTPEKSNLTRTGQLLDSIKVVSVSKGKVVVGPEGSRTDSKATNEQIAAGQEARGRPFNHLSQKETNRIRTAMKEDLKAAVRRRLTSTKKQGE